MHQRTIAKAVKVTGIGIHKGKPIQLLLEPMDADAGIIFYRSDHAVDIPLSIDNVVNTVMATVIGKGDSYISTIEHFLSALYAYGIDNIRISVDSNEMPVMDGSAISFCMLLDEAGLQAQNSPKKIIRIKKILEIKDGKKFARFEPAKDASFEFNIEFPHPAIKRQSHLYRASKKSFVEEIARARTFGFAKDMQSLQSKNLALGASLKNAIGLDNRKVLNREGLRFENEFVRHKILDAMGDMMVTGYNILGKYSAFAGSHELNHRLTKKIFEFDDNYEFVAIEQLEDLDYGMSFA
ncbi:MAG: UDP-3-O-acyl-N-acetylglucosamine deacetylase [Sulfurovum sp.]|nr:UDP-3-O-acyl-N-acetylglucosamine deacetylase [Sulfurovum sp.]